MVTVAIIFLGVFFLVLLAYVVGSVAESFGIKKGE